MNRKTTVALAAAMFALVAAMAGAEAGTLNERQAPEFRRPADSAPAVRGVRPRTETVEEKPLTTPSESAPRAG